MSMNKMQTYCDRCNGFGTEWITAKVINGNQKVLGQEKGLIKCRDCKGTGKIELV